MSWASCCRGRCCCGWTRWSSDRRRSRALRRWQAHEGHGGAVTLIQRFGSAANLKVDLRCLELDGCIGAVPILRPHSSARVRRRAGGDQAQEPVASRHHGLSCVFPYKLALSSRSTSELAARRAIRSIEGKDIDNVSEYLNPQSPKYEKMVDWIRREIGSTTLPYQTLEDMIQAIGLPREKLCVHCWMGE